MNFKKVVSSELNPKTETTQLISCLDYMENNKYVNDALCLENMVSVWYGKGDKTKCGERAYWGEKAFGVALYITRFGISDNYVNSNITMTYLKNSYKGKAYNLCEEENGIITNEITECVIENLDMQKNETRSIPFKNNIQIKAQSTYQRIEGYGKTNSYYIVGVKLWRFY